VSPWKLLAAAVVIVGVGLLLLQRYKRFAQYRVTRAAMSTLLFLHELTARDSNRARHSQKPE